MNWVRPLLAFCLAAIAVVLAACSSPAASAPPATYTESQLERVDLFASGIVALRDRLPELQGYLEAEDWPNVRNFIHGPLGDLRARMARLSRTLLPEDAEAAQAAAKELFGHLEKLDAAAEAQQRAAAETQYREALEDFDAFLARVPAGTA